jgi:glycosyltransferase 2 family protein
MGIFFGKWHTFLSRIIAVVVIAVFVYWIWQNQVIVRNVFVETKTVVLVGILLLINLGILLQSAAFTFLVRGMGYPFRHSDSYHSLNLSQIAAMVPGKVWGFAGLAGLLWVKGISKSDSVTIITLQTLLLLSAAVFVGTVGLISIIGWYYLSIIFMPILLLLFRHSFLSHLIYRLLPNSSPLPPRSVIILSITLGIMAWVSVSVGFSLLIHSAEGEWPLSPLTIISSFPVGYVAGYISLIAPSGLGIREGVITIILGPFLGMDRALGLAIVFRAVHMAVIFINILITMVILSFDKRNTRINIRNPGS